MIWSWLWLGVLIIAVIFEAITDKKIFVWFIPASIIAAIVDFIPDTIIIQLIVFTLISAIGIFGFRRILSVFSKKHKRQFDIEDMIGERCIVIDKIDTFAGRGHAKVKGQIYAARGLYDDDTFEVGESVQIVAIEGVKLVCKKA